MTLRGRAVNVKRVRRGPACPTMHEYITPGETTVVLVPLGYADGVPRRVGNRGEVLLARRPLPDRRPGRDGSVRGRRR